MGDVGRTKQEFSASFSYKLFAGFQLATLLIWHSAKFTHTKPRYQE